MCICTSQTRVAGEGETRTANVYGDDVHIPRLKIVFGLRLLEGFTVIVWLMRACLSWNSLSAFVLVCATGVDRSTVCVHTTVTACIHLAHLAFVRDVLAIASVSCVGSVSCRSQRAGECAACHGKGAEIPGPAIPAPWKTRSQTLSRRLSFWEFKDL